MRMRSVAVFMQVTPSINVNDFPGDEITPDQKGDGVRNVLRMAMTLEPDVVVMGVSLRDPDSIETIHEILGRSDRRWRGPLHDPRPTGRR